MTPRASTSSWVEVWPREKRSGRAPGPRPRPWRAGRGWAGPRGGAGRAGRAGDALRVQQHEQRVALTAGEGEVERFALEALADPKKHDDFATRSSICCQDPGARRSPTPGSRVC